MRFTVEIELGNEAMETWQDLRDALKRVAGKMGSKACCLGSAPSNGDGSKIMDENGNSVGRWDITE